MPPGLRRGSRSVAAAVVSLVVAIVAVEIVGQNFYFTGSRAYFFADVDHRMQPDPGHKINADGIRSTRAAEDFRAEDWNVLLLGDSFIYGWGLRYEETIPSKLELLARPAHPDADIRVVNFGWTSASPLLSLRQLREIGAKYRPDVVILAVDMSDIHDDIKYQRLLERYGALKLLAWTPSTVWILRKSISLVPALDGLHERAFGFPRDRRFWSRGSLHETRPGFAWIRRSIEGLAHHARTELGARFLVIVLPRYYHYNDREAPESWDRVLHGEPGPHAYAPFEYFEAMRAEVDFPVHSLLQAFQATDVFPTCFPDDPHWNASGAAVAAQAIFDLCERAGCFPRDRVTGERDR